MGPSESAHRTGAATPAREPSRAAKVARLALDVALALDGVVEGDGGRLGQRSTPDRGERLPGVVAAARADGRFDVELYLVARPVPLHPLADRIRDGIDAAARAAGIQSLIGPVDIAFEDLEEAPAATSPPGAGA